MKKSVMRIGIVVITVILIVLGLLVWSFFGIIHHIHTEYGDSFTVLEALWTDDITLKDNNSGYFVALSDYSGKRSIIPICDSPYFRCYQIDQSNNKFYICKIKKYDIFIDIFDEYPEDIKGRINTNKEWFVSAFLCDYHYMEIILPYLDELYHDEMIAVAQKLVKHDFEGLDKYGLTEEMINDKESLEEKIGIMEKWYEKQKKNS